MAAAAKRFQVNRRQMFGMGVTLLAGSRERPDKIFPAHATSTFEFTT
jgi:hypothetical protein